MDVSVIIVNYKTADLVIDCVRSIFEQTQGSDLEIIVVDNCSEDDSIEKLKAALGEKIKVVISPENLGFGKGNNLGAEYASGRYLFLLNPDTYLLNDAIGILADFLDAHPEAGVAGGKLYFPDQSPSPSFCRAFDTTEAERREAAWHTILGRKSKEKLGHRSEQLFSDSFNHTDEPLPVAYVFGADMMIRRELFQKFNGFDPDFFMYAEEEELSYRISRAGYQIVNVPAAKIVHLEGASTQSGKALNEAQFRMRMQGKLLYYRKCFGDEGMEAFYQARSLKYRRLKKLAGIRGKKHSQAAVMLGYLEDEYRKFKEIIAEQNT